MKQLMRIPYNKKFIDGKYLVPDHKLITNGRPQDKFVGLARISVATCRMTCTQEDIGSFVIIIVLAIN